MAIPPATPFAGHVGAHPPRLRVALATAAFSGVPVDPECAQAAHAVAAQLSSAGHDVDDATPAIDADLVREVYDSITLVALAGVPDIAPVTPGPDTAEGTTLAAFERARTLTAVDIGRGFRAFHAVARSAALFFEDHDLLVTPTLAHPPWPHGRLEYDRPGRSMASWIDAIFEYGPFTAPFNIGGQPAISVPTGQSADGLPIGVQLVAAHGREDLLLRVAAHLEEALPWAGRRSCVHAAG
jgi:amidase